MEEAAEDQLDEGEEPLAEAVEVQLDPELGGLAGVVELGDGGLLEMI